MIGQLAPSNQLYAIDTALDILVTQANNAGTLATVAGPGLGINATDLGGFDISSTGLTTGIGFAAFTDIPGSSSLYTISLANGVATSFGTLPFDIAGLTVVAVPEPTSMALIGIMSIGGVAYRRRRRAAPAAN